MNGKALPVRRLLLGVMLCGALALAPRSLAIHQDSEDYLRHAGYPLHVLLGIGSGQEYEMHRPFLFPLLLKTLGATSTETLNGPLLLWSNWVLVWSMLGLFAWRVLGNAPGRAAAACGAGLVFLFGFSEFLWPWQACALSEIYCILFFLAAFYGVLNLSAQEERGSIRHLVVAVAATALAMQIRFPMITQTAALVLALGADRVHAPQPGPGNQVRRPIPKAWLTGAGAVLAAVTAYTLIAYRNLSQWPDLYHANFVTMRVLQTPGGAEKLARRLAIPHRVTAAAGKGWFESGWDQDGERMAWASIYRKEHHARFVLSEPGLMFRIFRDSGGEVLRAAGGMFIYQQYLYDWPLNKASLPPDLVKGRIHKANQLVCAPLSLLTALNPLLPLMLPAALVAVFFLLPCRLGSMRILPGMTYLSVTFYGQYGLTIFFEGVEDARHAFVGTAALVILCWMTLGVVFFGSRIRRPERSVGEIGEREAPEETEAQLPLAEVRAR